MTNVGLRARFLPPKDWRLGENVDVIDGRMYKPPPPPDYVRKSDAGKITNIGIRCSTSGDKLRLLVSTPHQTLVEMFINAHEFEAALAKAKANLTGEKYHQICVQKYKRGRR